MQNWTEVLCAQLDKDRPDWYFAWATQQDLIDEIRHRGTKDQKAFLSERVSARLFHTILHAALGAGIVKEP